MMRLPHFQYRSPRTLAEAATVLAGEGPAAMLLAGGTDLLPNMKRRQQTPATLVGLRRVAGFDRVALDGEMRLGAGATLTSLVRDGRLKARAAALWQAAAQVATPQLRNMATLGGNICLDTRCNYYDQSYEWRQAIDFCMKKDGAVCWVAPGSDTCLAVSSTDTGPALIALGARVRLVSARGEREVAIADLYALDGIAYLTRRPDEILADVHLPATEGWRSAYWKLRRRGSFDFPVLSVAAAARLDERGVVLEARIVLGSVASRPLPVHAAAAALVGQRLTDEVIEATALVAARPGRPMDNTDFGLHWRRKVLRSFVGHALRELRGDDMREIRRRLTRRATFDEA